MPLREIVALRAAFAALEKGLSDTICVVDYSQASAAAQRQIDKATEMLEEIWCIMGDLDAYEAEQDRKGVNEWETE